MAQLYCGEIAVASILHSGLPQWHIRSIPLELSQADGLPFVLVNVVYPPSCPTEWPAGTEDAALMYLSKFHSGRTSASLRKFSTHTIGANPFCASAEKQPHCPQQMATSTAHRVRHCFTYIALQEFQLFAMKAALTLRLSRSACLPPSHLQGRRIERLSASTRGALRRLSTTRKIPPDDNQVRTRRVSSPPMQRSSISSSQNVYTQQAFS